MFTLIHNYSKSVSKAEIFDNLTNFLSSSFKGRTKKNFNRSTVFKCSFTDKSSIHNEIQCLINGISLSHFMHVPSSSAGDGPALPLVGVFMNKGNMVLSPRISTNF